MIKSLFYFFRNMFKFAVYFSVVAITVHSMPQVPEKKADEGPPQPVSTFIFY